MPQIITLAHQKGGVGKSTLTFNLANVFKENFKVAIFDLDPQGTLFEINKNINKFEGLEVFSYLDHVEKIKTLSYDFVFVDSPPYLSKNLHSIFQISDLILIPTKAGVPDLTSIGTIINLVKRFNKEEKSLIVLSMLKHKINVLQKVKKVLENYTIELSKTQIMDRVAYSTSMITNGVKGDRKAHLEIENLAEEIILKLNA